MDNPVIARGVRIADEGIYLQEDRYSHPKEQTKQVYELLGLDDAPAEASLCDVGCATGEFLYHVRSRKPRMQLAGIDVSAEMIRKAEMHVPGAQFHLGSANEPGTLEENRYDFVTMLGVVGIFDDPTVSLNNCIEATRAGGKVVVLASFNPYPIDLINRYRRAHHDGAPWEIGWNVHSKLTVERIVNAHPRTASLSWHDFEMPFDVERKEDPMRCWTTRVGDNPRFHVNGASLLVDMKMLLIECR